MPPKCHQRFLAFEKQTCCQEQHTSSSNFKRRYEKIHEDHCHARPPSPLCSTATPAPVGMGKGLTGQGCRAPRQPRWSFPFEQRWYQLRMVQRARLSGTRANDELRRAAPSEKSLAPTADRSFDVPRAIGRHLLPQPR